MDSAMKYREFKHRYICVIKILNSSKFIPLCQQLSRSHIINANTHTSTVSNVLMIVDHRSQAVKPQLLQEYLVYNTNWIN
jgi:hypothetical protein